MKNEMSSKEIAVSAAYKKLLEWHDTEVPKYKHLLGVPPKRMEFETIVEMVEVFRSLPKDDEEKSYHFLLQASPLFHQYLKEVQAVGDLKLLEVFEKEAKALISYDNKFYEAYREAWENVAGRVLYMLRNYSDLPQVKHILYNAERSSEFETKVLERINSIIEEAIEGVDSLAKLQALHDDTKNNYTLTKRFNQKWDSLIIELVENILQHPEEASLYNSTTAKSLYKAARVGSEARIRALEVWDQILLSKLEKQGARDIQDFVSDIPNYTKAYKKAQEMFDAWVRQQLPLNDTFEHYRSLYRNDNDFFLDKDLLKEIAIKMKEAFMARKYLKDRFSDL